MEPGPIDVLDPAAFDLAPLPATAALPATPEEAEFDALAVVLERELGDIAAGLDQDWRTELELLHADAEEGIYQDPLTVNEDEFVAAEGAAAEADRQVLEAYDEIPAEAWQPVMAPYTPPAEEGGFVETEEPTRVPAPGVPPPTLPPPPAPTLATVHLENVTRGGSTHFWVGDGWTVDVRGTPLQVVTCSGSQDGEPFGPASFGLTDNYGRFDVSGALSDVERGHWVEMWYVGGQLCTPVLVFDVL